MNKKIEIPEGYTARIEGNSIILEPKESDDERIRKTLLRCCDDWDKGQFGCMKREDVASIRAYLERQKEQKPVDIDFVSDWLRKHIKTYVNSEYNEFHKTVEYDGSINIEHLIEDLKKAIEQQPFAHESDFVSKPAEWSEEDEKMLWGFTAWIPPEELAKHNITRNDILEKLKSLRSQPKEEWSEEDERLLNIIIDILDREEHNGHLMYGDLKACVKLLKSVRPQPYWKPSEEQMEALRKVAYKLGNSCFGESWANDKNLHSLYVALQKLL